MSCASGRGSGASVGRPREGGKEGGRKGGAGAAAAVAARKWRGPPAASVPGFEEGAELTRLRSRWGCDISGPPRAALPRARPDGGGHRPPSPSHPGLRVARRSLSPSRGCHRAHPAALGFAPKGTRSSKDRDVGALLSHWGRWGTRVGGGRSGSAAGSLTPFLAALFSPLFLRTGNESPLSCRCPLPSLRHSSVLLACMTPLSPLPQKVV